MCVEQGADEASVAEQASHRIRQEKCLSVLGAFKQFILPKNTEWQDKLKYVTRGLQEPNCISFRSNGSVFANSVFKVT